MAWRWCLRRRKSRRMRTGNQPGPASETDLPVRMGIHSGPVHTSPMSINAKTLPGPGSISPNESWIAGMPGTSSFPNAWPTIWPNRAEWQPYLHDLGDVEVKHGQVVSVVNFYADVVGNPAPPKKIRRPKRKSHHRQPSRERFPSLVPLLVGAFLLFAVAGAHFCAGDFEADAIAIVATDTAPRQAGLQFPKKVSPYCRLKI